MRQLLPVLALCLAAVSAHADTYQFTFTGTSGEEPSTPMLIAGFSVPAVPTTVQLGSNHLGQYFEIQSSDAFYDPYFNGIGDIYFYADGSIDILDANLGENGQGTFDFLDIGLDRPTFTGPLDAPTFQVGSYHIGGTYDGGSFDAIGTATVTDITETPEPSSFVLLTTGLFGAGGMWSRRWR